MPKPRTATGITRGYAPDRKTAARLKAFGVRTVYCGEDGEIPGVKFTLREGETLGIVDSLRAFGNTRRAMQAAVKLVHSWNATIIDVEHNENSRDHCIQMLERALAHRPLESDKAAEMQQLSAAARRANRWPKESARAAWHSYAIQTPEDFTKLTSWPQSTAYAAFGPRFMIPKPTSKKK